jgi:hypothetical protein
MKPKDNRIGLPAVSATMTVEFSVMLAVSAMAQDDPPGPLPGGFGEPPPGRRESAGSTDSPLQPPPSRNAHTAYKLRGAYTLNGGTATWENRSHLSTNTDKSAVPVKMEATLL